jgi:hypothetical protein
MAEGLDDAWHSGRVNFIFPVAGCSDCSGACLIGGGRYCRCESALELDLDLSERHQNYAAGDNFLHIQMMLYDCLQRLPRSTSIY